MADYRTATGWAFDSKKKRWDFLQESILKSEKHFFNTVDSKYTKMDNVCIWERELTSAEIKELIRRTPTKVSFANLLITTYSEVLFNKMDILDTLLNETDEIIGQFYTTNR